jgi:integrase
MVTGMRRGELGGLTWGAVDFERGTVVVRQSIGDDRRGGYYLKQTKTGRERVFPLDAVAVEALRGVRARQAREKLAAGAAYDDQGLVFADQAGRPMKLDAPTKAFTAAARRLGISGVTLHSCRHGFATWALADGADLRSVSAVLGHSAPSTTLNVYGHVVAGGKERAVATATSALTAAKARQAAGTNRQG